MAEILEMVQNYGLGIVLTVYLIYKDMVISKNQNEEMKKQNEEIREVKEQTTVAINNNTAALNDISRAFERLEIKVDHVDQAVS